MQETICITVVYKVEDEKVCHMYIVMTSKEVHDFQMIITFVGMNCVLVFQFDAL